MTFDRQIRLADRDHITEAEDALMRGHLMFFLPAVFTILHRAERPLIMQWYLRAMCEAFHKVALGNSRRLVINVPPRHLKSITSMAFVAWMLGRAPQTKIMLVTYGSSLVQDHLANLHMIMSSPLYRRLFPETRLEIVSIGQQLLSTTKGGNCRGVTIGGATTGHGADIIIIDDAMKADDINSQARRDEVDRFYGNTLISRLNNKLSGSIISGQQRLGEDDLPGRLVDAGADHLCLPSWHDEEQLYDIGLGRIYRRPPGELLQPGREPMHILKQFQAEMTDADFSAHYLQRPGAVEGNIIRPDAFGRFVLDDYPRTRFHKIVMSVDPATSAQPRADYSVFLTTGFLDGSWYILDVIRERLEFPQLVDRVRAHHRLWKADVLLVEDATIGQQLGQDLRHRHHMRPIMLRPNADKVTRMVGQLAIIEDGGILLPITAPWLSQLLSEFRHFPRGQHDDQVDALAQFLDWSKRKDKWARTETDPGTGRRYFVQRRETPRRR